MKKQISLFLIILFGSVLNSIANCNMIDSLYPTKNFPFFFDRNIVSGLKKTDVTVPAEIINQCFIDSLGKNYFDIPVNSDTSIKVVPLYKVLIPDRDIILVFTLFYAGNYVFEESVIVSVFKQSGFQFLTNQLVYQVYGVNAQYTEFYSVDSIVHYDEGNVNHSVSLGVISPTGLSYINDVFVTDTAKHYAHNLRFSDFSKYELAKFRTLPDGFKIDDRVIENHDYLMELNFTKHNYYSLLIYSRYDGDSDFPYTIHPIGKRELNSKETLIIYLVKAEHEKHDVLWFYNCAIISDSKIQKTKVLGILINDNKFKFRCELMKDNSIATWNNGKKKIVTFD